MGTREIFDAISNDTSDLWKEICSLAAENEISRFGQESDHDFGARVLRLSQAALHKTGESTWSIVDPGDFIHLALIDAEMTAWAIGRGLDRHEAEDAAISDHKETYGAPRLATLDWIDISATEYEQILNHGGIGWRG